MLNNLLECVFEFLKSFGTSPLFYVPLCIIFVSWVFRLVWDMVKGRY